METLEAGAIYESSMGALPDGDGVYEAQPINEPSCESKIGYNVLCGACPLVRLLGDCPKLIREQSASDELLGVPNPPEQLNAMDGANEFTVPDLLALQSPAEPLVSLREPTTASEPTMRPVEAEDPPETVSLGVTIEANASIGVTSSDNDNERVLLRSVLAVEVKPALVFAPLPSRPDTEPTLRSYRELLFDDTVQVVLAPQFQQRTSAPVAVPAATPEVFEDDVTMGVASGEIQPVFTAPAIHAAPSREGPIVAVNTLSEACRNEQATEKYDLPVAPGVCEELIPDTPALVSRVLPTLELASFTGLDRLSFIDASLFDDSPLAEVVVMDSPLVFEDIVQPPEKTTSPLLAVPGQFEETTLLAVRPVGVIKSPSAMSEATFARLDAEPEVVHEQPVLVEASSYPYDAVDSSLVTEGVALYGEPLWMINEDSLVGHVESPATYLPLLEVPGGHESDRDLDTDNDLTAFATPEVITSATVKAPISSIMHHIRTLIGSFAVVSLVAVSK